MKVQKLDDVLAAVIKSMGYEYVGCEYLPQGRHSLLRVYIDIETGITVDDCSRVSKQLSTVLDVEDPLPGQYTLEVSSPGVERPLFTLDHYRRFIGRRAKIHVKMPLNGRRNFLGVLKEIVNDEVVVIQIENELFTIPYENIEKGKLSQ